VNPSPAIDVSSQLSDAQVVARVRAGERALFEVLMRRYNQRLYRVVRAVLRDEGEVEEVMQQAYVNAFVHLHQFEERSQFSTWLTRIALNEAFARLRKARYVNATPPAGGDESDLAAADSDPERQAYAQEVRALIEQAIDALPETYRLVFVLCQIEGLSTSETS
jgi:RNA polymerase sigma-70 factor, ECF subfamily